MRRMSSRKNLFSLVLKYYKNSWKTQNNVSQYSTVQYVRVMWVFSSESESDDMRRRVCQASREGWLVHPFECDVQWDGGEQLKGRRERV